MVKLTKVENNIPRLSYPTEGIDKKSHNPDLYNIKTIIF